MRNIGAVLLGTLMLAACDPTADHRFRTEGPGIDLYSAQTVEATRVLKAYLDQLCVQADITAYSNDNRAPDCPTRSLSPTDWKLVVHTGFNEIDRRCDEYMRWLDEKRSERGFVNQGLTDLSTLATGILDIAAPQTRAISYLAISLGFTESVYNEYHNLILLGLESSTVKKLVYERRLKFRAAFRNNVYSAKPDAIFAMKSYLRICTPPDILLKVNDYSRAAAVGDTDPINDDLKTEKDAIGTPTPGTPFSAITPAITGQGRLVDPDPGRSFATIANGPFARPDMMAFQMATCISADGKIGPESRSAVAVYEQFVYGRNATRPALFNGKIDVSPELEELISGPTARCDRTLYGNYFEARFFGERPGNLRAFLGRLNAAFPDNPVSPDAALTSAEVRAKIRAARAALGLTTGFSALEDQVTLGLFEHIRARAQGRTYDGPIRGIRAG